MRTDDAFDRAEVLACGLVDTVEPAFLPILHRSGISFLPSPAVRRRPTFP
jgi:hypothetical protein